MDDMEYPEDEFGALLDQMSEETNTAMKAKGFHQDYDALVAIVHDSEHAISVNAEKGLDVMFALSQHALMNSEVAEMTEAVRKPGWSEHLSANRVTCLNCDGTGVGPNEPQSHRDAVKAGMQRDTTWDCVVCRGEKKVDPPWEPLTRTAGGERKFFTMEEEEAADLLIRLLHYSGRRNLRLGDAYRAKTMFNARRPYKHGKLA